jgi:hypothetical protein
MLLSVFVAASVIGQPNIKRLNGSGECMALSDTIEFETDSLAIPRDNFYWSVAGDLQIVGSTTDTIVRVYSFNKNTAYNVDGYGKGRVYLHYDKADCGWNRVYYDVYKSFTPVDPIIGPECVIEGDTVVFSYKPILTVNINDQIGTDSYKWTIPTGVNAGDLYYSADSSSVTFVVDQLTGEDTIKVQIGQCNFGDPAKYTWLALNQSVPKPTIAGDACAKSGPRTVTLWVQNINQGATYTWSKSNANWSFIGDAVGDTIQLTTDDFGSGDVYVNAIANNGCVSSSTFSISRCN